MLPCAALAADALVAELEQRLASTGVESVNDHLTNAQPDAVMLSRFNRKAASCELQAVSLAIRLARGANARAVQAHEESLRAATGRCARRLITSCSMSRRALRYRIPIRDGVSAWKRKG